MFSCKSCQKEAIHYARGFCQACYMIRRRIDGGAELKARHAAAERERRKRMADEYRQKDRERNIRRRDQRKIYSRAYYQTHKEKIQASYLDYIKRRRDVAYAVKARYKARKAQLPATLTPQDWEYIKDGFAHRCVYCNRQMQRLTQDHIIPVSRGGGYTPDNIVPACASCNSRKHCRDAIMYLIEIAEGRHTP